MTAWSRASLSDRARNGHANGRILVSHIPWVHRGIEFGLPCGEEAELLHPGIGLAPEFISCYVQDHEEITDIGLGISFQPRRQAFQAEVDPKLYAVTDSRPKAECDIRFHEQQDLFGLVSPQGDGWTSPPTTSRSHWPRSAASHVVRHGSSNSHLRPSATTTAPVT